MNKKLDIKNPRFRLVDSTLKGYKEVEVVFNYNGEDYKYFIFVDEDKNVNYINEAEKQFNQDIKSGEVLKTINVKPINHRPWLIAGASVLGVAAITFASLFTWKMVAKNKDEPEPEPSKDTYTLTFDCSNCKIYDENDKEITGSIDVKPTQGTISYCKFFIKSDDNYHLPLGCDISIKNGDEKIDNYTYNASTGELIVPIVSDLKITAPGFKKDITLEECSWAEINELSTTGQAKDFFDVYDPEKPTLNCKRVQLKHQDKNNNGVIDEGEIYQTVRIIDFYHDVDEKGKPIGITFEFKDVISDDIGYSIATQWNDVSVYDMAISNRDYLNSSIRKALVNKGGGHILWAQKDATTWSNQPGGPYTNKSVLDMLPDDLTEDGILKSPSKYTNIWNEDKDPNPGFEEQIVNDKLFLLSPKEIGYNPGNNAETSPTPYKYYEDCDETVEVQPIRIKNQANHFEGGVYEEISADAGQAYEFEVGNSAGCASPGGSLYWLRSPRSTDDGNDGRAWEIYTESGAIGFASTYATTCPVAPAFCI